MTVATIGVREFRANLADHIESQHPVAVTRHGHTVGFFIPVKTDLTQQRAAFREAAARFDELIPLAERQAALADFGDLRRLDRR